METKDTHINDFDSALICEYFSSFKRQGPGSPDMTIKALSFIDNLTPKSKIADLGCGTGGQTITLAQNIAGDITGIDIFPDFINIFNDNAKKQNLQDRVKGVTGSMDNLTFQNEELDLIWSEGAIYNIGFERGFKEWNKYLKKGGFIAVTEASWFTESRPSEIEEYWNFHYPAITTIADCVSIMQKTGYIPVSVFTLPEYCWTDNYFAPQIPVQEKCLNKYKESKAVKEFVESARLEEKMYQKYKEFYGYVFYIGKKI
ncbi:MAG: class I SAM-dependent methyltransferase [Endomicrobia bacterium]|nr:class I SAM-dependent methyltransferase [Endomicrobiia bacterium]MCL2506385.1 class I SAM-dependent methyltransferase [Endomicrobiia bacterium]